MITHDVFYNNGDDMGSKEYLSKLSNGGVSFGVISSLDNSLGNKGGEVTEEMNGVIFGQFIEQMGK